MGEPWLERQMFRKVPLWLVLLLGVFAFVGMVAFSNVAIHAYKGGTKAGKLGDFALAASTIPELLERMDVVDPYLRIPGGFHAGKSGFHFTTAPGARPDAGFLLLSYYDGDQRRSVVEYWDLDQHTMVHRWLPPINEINDAATDFFSNEVDLKRDRNLQRMLVRHPVVMANGDLVIKSRSPLTRIDACDQIVWINDDHVFHHAVQPDADGTMWLSSKFEPPSIPGVKEKTFFDDAITAVTASGDLAFKRSVSALFIENGMAEYVYGRSEYTDNPIHLNDVQPVLEDGKFWKKGDVFLSLRNNSMIVLYRPSTDEILWYKTGPWSHQHDVDVLDDHRISIFDNHAFLTGGGGKVDLLDELGGHSSIAVYDFETDEVTYPWNDALGALDMTSKTEGLHTVRPNGNLFVEEQNRGRLFELDPQGAVVWDYVNRAERDGDLYRTGWGRLIEPEPGAAIARSLRNGTCGNRETHMLSQAHMPG